MNDTQLACAAQHFGLWAVRADWLNTMASAYNAGKLPTVAVGSGCERNEVWAAGGKLPKVVTLGRDGNGNPRPLFSVDQSGIAFVSITDKITKGESSFGGTSSVRTRQALRGAEADKDVRGIMMMIDSPGGAVAGLKPLADEVARIRREGVKPIAAHAEDAMHSAALWVGVQAQRVTASAMTGVGSIGTLAVVQDLSGVAEKEGIKIHVISTGKHKGAGVPGTEITDEHLERIQTRVDEINGFFLDAVKKGRGMGIESVRALADGRDWLAAQAKENGLIDDVMSQDDAVRTFRVMIRDRDRERSQAAAGRSRAAKIAGLT